jgi:hypothetical protein
MRGRTDISRSTWAPSSVETLRLKLEATKMAAGFSGCSRRLQPALGLRLKLEATTIAQP